MRAYSLDLRQKIIAALDRGQLPSQVAAAFGVGVSTVKRYRQPQRQTGQLVPTPSPGPRCRLTTEQEAALRAQVAQHDDATLAEHCTTWARAQGVRVSPPIMCRWLQRLGVPRNKRRASPASATRPRGRLGTPRSPRPTPPISSSSLRAASTAA